jgi:hypothetical protein
LDVSRYRVRLLGSSREQGSAESSLFFEGSRFTDEALECAISQFFYFLNPFKIPSAIGIIFACLEKVSKHRVHFAPVWQL